MMRWMYGVSLKDRKRSVDLYRLLDIQSVADVVRQGRSRWFGHPERLSVECEDVPHSAGRHDLVVPRLRLVS